MRHWGRERAVKGSVGYRGSTILSWVWLRRAWSFTGLLFPLYQRRVYLGALRTGSLHWKFNRSTRMFSGNWSESVCPLEHDLPFKSCDPSSTLKECHESYFACFCLCLTLSPFPETQQASVLRARLSHPSSAPVQLQWTRCSFYFLMLLLYVPDVCSANGFLCSPCDLQVARLFSPIPFLGSAAHFSSRPSVWEWLTWSL